MPPVVSGDDDMYSHHSDLQAPAIHRGKEFNPLDPFLLKDDECYQHNASEEGEEVISSPRSDVTVCLECFKLIPHNALSKVATKRECCGTYTHKTCLRKYTGCSKCLPFIPKGGKWSLEYMGVIEYNEDAEEEDEEGE
ncbi:hypothetical protein Leryth_017020, partial [Lithospermum erythrorhizon]